MTIIEQGSGPAPQAASDLIKETTTQTFVKDVIEESKRQPVLIDFWAPWCGPCRQLTPIIEKAVRAAKGKVKLVKMNIDEHPAIPGQMGIQSIPAVIAFVNGQPADGFMGAVPESQVTAFINKLTAGMPGAGEPNIAEILQRGRSRAGRGRSRHRGARSMPRCWRRTPPISRRLPGSRNATWRPAPSSRPSRRSPWCRNRSAAMRRSRRCRSSIDLAEQAKALGPVTELEQKVAANPLDHQARFDLATALNASGKRTEATQQLLEIVKRDRKWNEDGARKQLVQFFEAWGPTDEATVEGRKRLSTILFSVRVSAQILRRMRDPGRLAPGPQMPINAEYRGPGDLPEDHSGISVARRAAAAARPDAAQHLRAALSRDGRRCACATATG